MTITKKSSTFHNYGVKLLQARINELDIEINRLLNISFDNSGSQCALKDNIHQLKVIKTSLEFDVSIIEKAREIK